MRSAIGLVALTLAGAAFANPVLASECAPSRWGADDEIGNANLITADSVLRASKLIRTG